MRISDWSSDVCSSDLLMRKPDVQLAMLPKAGSRRMITCQAELCTGRAISSIQWRPHSDEVLFTVTDAHEGQAQSIYRWDVGPGAVPLVTHSAGILNGGVTSLSGGFAGTSEPMWVLVAQ